VDHYPTEFDRKQYVYSRTTGDAAKHLKLGMKEGTFQTWQEMLQVLAQIHENPREEDEARTEYQLLFMAPGETFFDFKTHFLHLAKQAKIEESRWKNDLFDKITRPLQQALFGQRRRCNFHELCELVADIDMDQRLAQTSYRLQRTPGRTATKETPTNRTADGKFTSFAKTAMDTTMAPRRSATPGMIHRPTDPRSTTAPPLAENITCYNCSRVGHYAGSCPHPRRSPGDVIKEVEESDSYEPDAGDSQEESRDMMMPSGNGDA
jgi:hypothetical protein